MASDLVNLINIVEDENMGETIDPDQMRHGHDPDGGLSILHLNISSVRRNFDSLVAFLEAYDLNFFDIIALTECFQLDSYSEFSLNGYNTYYNNGSINKNDGVLTFVRSGLNHEVKSHTLQSTKILVSRLILDVNSVKYGLTIVYRSPSTNKNNFINDFEYYFKNDITEKNIEVVVGDINFDLLDNQDPLVVTYYSMLTSNGFKSYVNNVTREKTKSCLDHVFVKMNLKLNNISTFSYIIKTDITDHYPISLNIATKKDKDNTESNIRRMSKINWRRLSELFGGERWAEVLNTNEAELSFNKFITILQNHVSQSKTVKTVKMGHKKIKPWISQGLIKAIKKRDRLKRQLQTHFTIEKEIEYKNYRNHLKKLLNTVKNEYYKQKIESTKQDIKKTYKIITEITNNRKKESPLKVTDAGDKDFDTDLEMANHCNEYFSNIGLQMLGKIPQVDLTDSLESVNRSIFLAPVTDGELIQHVSSLKTNSAPGFDGITVELIKNMHQYLLEPLKHVYNLIFKTGIVPSHFKKSIIIPIYKSGKKNKISNYRPISLISNFAKVFEKCLKNRLTNFFTKNGLLSKNQYGFTEGVGTADAMHSLLKEVTDNINENRRCIAVFLDLAKAFDTVSHTILLRILESNGVRGTALGLCANYLTDREQQTRVADVLSDPQRINIGVPQGTVLGPIFFNIYIKALVDQKINAKIISYADDTVVVFCGGTWEEVKSGVVDGLKRVKTWLDIHKLSLNLQKTNYIAFTKIDRNRPDFTFIEIDTFNEKINEVPHTKYLGILVDSNLKWTKHVEYVTKKVKTLIYRFYILRNILSKALVTSLYQSLVESLLRYGILAWGAMYNNALNPLQIVQNKILKIIYKKDYLYPTHLLYNCKINNIRMLFFHSVVCFMHKKQDKNIVSHTYLTRNNSNNMLIIPNCRSGFYKRSVNYLGPKAYNLIPGTIKGSVRHKQFSKQAKKFIWENKITFMKLLS